MYRLTGYRLQQIRSCTSQRINVELGNHQYSDAEHIVNALRKSGYDEIMQHHNGTDTKNLFFQCRSNTKYPLGHKFHVISVTAIPC